MNDYLHAAQSILWFLCALVIQFATASTWGTIGIVACAFVGVFWLAVRFAKRIVGMCLGFVVIKVMVILWPLVAERVR